MGFLEVSIHYAIPPIWLIVIVVAALGGLIGGAIGRMSKPDKEDNIAILGTWGAGKTTLWRAITKSSEKVKQTVGSETIHETVVMINGVKRKIKQSRDISGASFNIRKYYEQLITEKDLIIFIFNVKNFLESDVYAEEVTIRLSVVTTYKDKSKKIHIIGSHIDKLTKKTKERRGIKNKVVQFTKIKLLMEELNCDIEKDFILLNLANVTSKFTMYKKWQC